MSVSLYYNPRCPDCVRQAKLTARLDWLGRVELRTDDSPLGTVPVGEIVVVERERSRVFTGVYATRKVRQETGTLVYMDRRMLGCFPLLIMTLLQMVGLCVNDCCAGWTVL